MKREHRAIGGGFVSGAFAPIVALALAQGVIAAPAPHRQPPATIVVEPAAMLIAACDGDADGQTTRAELSACIARSFADVDRARAGSIGYILYSDWALKWLGDRNALPSPFGVDSDNDDRITLPELPAAFTGLFDRFDANKDGAVTRAELITLRGIAPLDAGEGRGGRSRAQKAR